MATAMPPAVYLRHYLSVLYKGINGRFEYIKIVDKRGRKIFESEIRKTGGMVYIKPGLQNCAPMTLNPPSTPCPVP